MNIVFLHEGITQSLIPLLTIAEHHPDSIVGCILMSTQHSSKEQLPQWFFNVDDTASSLLKCVNEGKTSSSMSAFLIVREPDSFLQLNVLAAIDCFKFDSIRHSEGGKGGKKLLEVLAKHNIRTSISKAGLPLYSYSSKSFFGFFGDSDESLHKRNEKIKAAFEEAFGKLAQQWLTDSWGLDPVSYYEVS